MGKRRGGAIERTGETTTEASEERFDDEEEDADGDREGAFLDNYLQLLIIIYNTNR